MFGYEIRANNRLYEIIEYINAKNFVGAYGLLKHISLTNEDSDEQDSAEQYDENTPSGEYITILPLLKLYCLLNLFKFNELEPEKLEIVMDLLNEVFPNISLVECANALVGRGNALCKLKNRKHYHIDAYYELALKLDPQNAKAEFALTRYHFERINFIKLSIRRILNFFITEFRGHLNDQKLLIENLNNILDRLSQYQKLDHHDDLNNAISIIRPYLEYYDQCELIPDVFVRLVDDIRNTLNLDIDVRGFKLLSQMRKKLPGIIEQDPENIDAKLLFCDILLFENDRTAALSLLKNAVRTNLKSDKLLLHYEQKNASDQFFFHPSLSLHLAMYYYDKGNIEKTCTILQKSIEFLQKELYTNTQQVISNFNFTLALIYFSFENHNKTIEHLEKAEQHSQILSLRFIALRIMIHLDLNQIHEALQLLKPLNLKQLSNDRYGKILLLAWEWAKATPMSQNLKQCCETMITQEKDPILRSLLQIIFAKKYCQQKQYVEAEKHLLAILETQPNHMKALHYLGYIILDSNLETENEKEKATKFLNVLTEHLSYYPHASHLRFLQAQLHHKLADHANAVKALTRCRRDSHQLGIEFFQQHYPDEYENAQQRPVKRVRFGETSIRTYSTSQNSESDLTAQSAETQTKTMQ